MSRSQTKDKAKLIEQLAKTPIVQIACERSGIPRATYYRWVKSDKKFARGCLDAIKQSSDLVNDMAESQLISAIKDKNLSAIIYWLKHRHPAYITKIKLDADIKYESEELTPEQTLLVKKALQLANLLHDEEVSDEGWMSWPVFSKQAHNAINTLQNASLALGDDRHALIRKFKNSKGAVSEYCHPEAVRLINLQLGSYELAPLDWQNANNVAAQCGTTHKTIYKIVDQYRDSHPEWFGLHKSERNAVSEYYHPALILEISAVIEPRNRNRAEKTQLQQEQSELRSNVQDFLKEVIDNDSIEAQEFRGLINLFGGERVIDLLYQYHPEYKKIPVPYVKSVLADYLGDFLAEPSSFDLDEIETGIGFLYDSNLRDGLIEVVKRDCLSFYSQQKLENLTFDDLDAILGHINDLRVKTADFNTEGLGQVFDEVENYYRLLFEEIQKPDRLVDELKPGRAFPDLNQRINIHEISTKHKILIADEMGVGKSASAILTKEFLEVEQALIVVPSNVIETWKAYLSDLIVDGETVGYFKAGQAPRVLVAESLEALQKSNPDDYDYVILSQERLNERYVEALGQFNYGMLIVDEVHKMKNLIEGKRAENLIELAERINDQNGAKYLAILSGTPIPNKVGDIAMILKLLYPEKFERVSNQELTSQLLKGDVLDLRSLLVPRMQMKSLAESVKMPKLEEKVHEVELTAEEREIYEILLEEDELTASQKMQILRKFTLNPSLLDATPDMRGSKIQEVGASLRETFSKKDKVIMFVNGYIEGVIRGNNTIIEALNLPEDVEVFAIEGEVEKDARLAIQQELQSTGRKILVLVSGQTADVGVDFSGAEELYFYNEPWTEYDKKQQLGRVFRPGLKDDLIVRTFITTNTIEEGIHGYIKSKYRAVEKLLRGIPITDLEREMLKHSEDQNDSSLEVNPELAEYYFSSWDRLMKIYGHVKELGEDNFVEFLAKYGREYADSYTDVGGRSYQANASRLSGTLIDRFAKEKRKNPEDVRLLDIASGPEMLRRHIADEYSNRVISLDINEHHFAEAGQHRIVGSFLNLPIAANSIDYANLALALHYTNFVPSKGQYERIEVLREANRVLSIGGRVVISLMHTRDLKDESAFREAVTKLGFRVVERYTGKVEDGTHFRTRLFTLEKTHNGPNDVFEAVKLIGPDLMKGFKFTKRKAKLRDSRKISTSFAIEGQPTIKTRFNDDDLVTLKEEQLVSGQMARLKQKHGSIRDIPRDEVLAGGFSRIFNGKSYVLFKRLVAGSGSVVLR